MEIEPEKEKDLASRGWNVIGTSAKTAEGVEVAFETLAKAVLGSRKPAS